MAATFIGPASSPLGLPDVFWTLLTGAWITAHGTLLDSDPFTAAPHVAGPVVNLQWLAGLLFYRLDALGGLPLVITATAAAVAATYGLLLVAAAAASGHLRLSCMAVAVAYVLGLSNLSPRPQTLAYPIFALFMLAVMRAEWRNDTRLLWLLPPATVLWVNLHGSFFTGLTLLGCAAAARLIQERSLRSTRPYGVALVACLLASLANPYGPGSLIYLASIGSNPVIRDYVSEWAPTTVSSSEGILLFGSLGVLAALAFKSRLRLTSIEVVVLLVFGCLAWSSVRAVVWWGMALAPVLARLAGGLLATRMATARERPLLNGLILTAIATVVAFSLPWTKSALPFLPADKQGLFTAATPVRVGDYLRTHDPPQHGKMFNTQAWGGYLEWAAWPRHQVFVDGRFELHPQQVWLDYLDVVFPGAGWRALLDKYDVGYLVLSTTEEADLVADLRLDSAWQIDYVDDQAAVFSRTPFADP